MYICRYIGSYNIINILTDLPIYIRIKQLGEHLITLLIIVKL